MIFHETYVHGAYIIDIEKALDERGFFARTWCKDEFHKKGLEHEVVQTSLSFNKTIGTLRGMHYQNSPWEESKLIRCTSGSIYDVIIDLRPDSETYHKWFGTEISAENYKIIYVPKNCAHGFITLKNDTEVVYQTSEYYEPSSEAGIRYNDPFFSIKWPLDINVISDKDKSWPDYVSE